MGGGEVFVLKFSESVKMLPKGYKKQRAKGVVIPEGHDKRGLLVARKPRRVGDKIRDFFFGVRVSGPPLRAAQFNDSRRVT